MVKIFSQGTLSAFFFGRLMIFFGAGVMGAVFPFMIVTFDKAGVWTFFSVGLFFFWVILVVLLFWKLSPLLFFGALCLRIVVHYLLLMWFFLCHLTGLSGSTQSVLIKVAAACVLPPVAIHFALLLWFSLLQTLSWEGSTGATGVVLTSLATTSVMTGWMIGLFYSSASWGWFSGCNPIVSANEAWMEKSHPHFWSLMPFGLIHMLVRLCLLRDT